MNRIALSVAATALTLAGIAASSAPALADPGEGAIVDNDAVCLVFVPKESGGFYNRFVIGERKVVTTPSGNIAGHCRAELPEDLIPSRAIRETAPCRAFPGAPLNGEAVVTAMPNGALHSMCQVHPASD